MSEYVFKPYNKPFKAKIAEFTAVRVSALAAGNIGKMFRKFEFEEKANKKLSSVLTDERERISAKIDENTEMMEYLSNSTNTGQLPVKTVIEKKKEIKEIKEENADLEVADLKLKYRIEQLNNFTVAQDLHVNEQENIKAQSNDEIVKEEVESKPIQETTLPPLFVEESTKEVTLPVSESKVEQPIIKQEITKDVSNDNDELEFLQKLIREVDEQNKTNGKLVKHNSQLLMEVAEKDAQLIKISQENDKLAETIKNKNEIILKSESEKVNMQQALKSVTETSIIERNKFKTEKQDLIEKQEQTDAKLQLATAENQGFIVKQEQTDLRLSTIFNENKQLREHLGEANQTIAVVTADRDLLQKDNTEAKTKAAEALRIGQETTSKNMDLEAKLNAAQMVIDSITKEKDQAIRELREIKNLIQSARSKVSIQQEPIEQEESKQI